MQIKNKKWKWTVLVFSLFTQIATVYYHQALTKYDWSGNDSKPIARWVLESHPKWYNPDPAIFISRYSMFVAVDITQSPAYFMKENGEITKFMVHREYPGNLRQYGYTDKQIQDATSNLVYQNDWAYIDVDEKFKSSLSPAALKKIDEGKRLQQQMKTIKQIPDWYNIIKKKAISQGMDVEEVLRRDAAYVLGIQIEITETRQETIARKVREIRDSPVWLKAIQEKAEQQKMLIDSVIMNEARFAADQEISKRNNAFKIN